MQSDVWPRGHDIIVIVVPTIEYRRSKNKVVHTTQDINVSIQSTLFENIPAAILHPLAGYIDR